MSDPITPLMTAIEPAGLDFWMTEVIRQCDQVRHDFAPSPVHDLRVALRRCRSLADGFMAFDPHPAWKLMKTESRKLFQQLGALRDTHVMMEWVQRLAPYTDEPSFLLRSHLERQESKDKENAASAVLEFNHKKWASWTRLLAGRVRQIPLESPAFQHLALERWSEAHRLHVQAVRNRSHVSYHRLRIALKKFRYTVENFLPSRHERWGPQLRELQDLLGEMHDLYVLWRTALAIKAIRTEKSHLEWRQRISVESSLRLERYREKVLGKTSLLLLWRAELPNSGEMENAALARLRVWASFRDPDISHSEHVAKLALQIYDGLNSLDLIPAGELPEARRILESAALAHAVGYVKAQKKHEVASYRLIRKLAPPLGLNAAMLQQIGLVVRFHRGALPRSAHKAFAGVAEERRKLLVLLSGILRLADAFDKLRGRRIYRLQLRRNGDVLCITAPGYSETGPSAVKLAAARHLLEVACRVPILIVSLNADQST